MPINKIELQILGSEYLLYLYVIFHTILVKPYVQYNKYILNKFSIKAYHNHFFQQLLINK